MPRIHDLGALEGRIVLFGGTCSNLQATRALLQAAEAAGVPGVNLVGTGDLLGFCASPAETLDLLCQSGARSVAGPVETALAGGDEAADAAPPPVSGAPWFAHARAALQPRHRAWLAACPARLLFRHDGKRYVAIHGPGGGDYLWRISSEDEFWRKISLLQEEVGGLDGVIAGHSGIAFERWIDGVHWINPGAVGRPPNDGGQTTSYAVLEDGRARFEPLEYDVAGAVRAFAGAGLDVSGAAVLQSGCWPDEDMLPKSLRR